MLDADRIEDLLRMYQLVSKIPHGLTVLINLLEAYIANQGPKSIVKSRESLGLLFDNEVYKSYFNKNLESIRLKFHKLLLANFSNLLLKKSSINLNKTVLEVYILASKTCDGLPELRNLLEDHIVIQGLTAIKKCQESALNDLSVYVSAILDVH